VRVEGMNIIEQAAHLVRPNSRKFIFSGIHGIAWDDVSDQPCFETIWRRLIHLIEEVEFLAAHNAHFDARVLRASCEAHGIPCPQVPFLCTLRLARQVWGIYPTRLPDVCVRLGIPLTHHDAASDALACARIVQMTADRIGVGPLRHFLESGIRS
jgi:DNA polymerase III subunit epsilon